MLRLVKVAATLLVAGGAAFYVLTMPTELPRDAWASLRAPDLTNGETMFNAGGCASCHATPGEDDKRRLGGGLALKTAFGTFKVPNISPDPKSGIGAWSEPQFANAMLKGVGRNGEHLYPSFPYTSYQRMPLADVRDLFAFMKTLPGIDKPNEPHDLTFPFNIRRSLGGWKLLYLDGKTFAPDPAKSAELNRGAYLVEGPGHCAECHSGRSALGGIDPARRFAGGPDPEGKGYIPNLTPHADGLANWSAKDIAYLLRTGGLPEGAGEIGDSMGDVVKNTSKLTDADRAAMAAYLKSLQPRPGKRPPKKS
jgi:mono/diheme cytochrome c family protein